MKDKKEKCHDHFNTEAAEYDRSARFAYPRKLHPLILDEIRALNFESLLDVGCGTGIILSVLEKERPSAKLAGLDLSEKMLEVARRRLSENVALVHGDSENLPFEDASFGIVNCSESFHHYPNPGKVFSEVKRVLKPGGYFVLCDMYIPAYFRAWVNFLMPRFSKGGDVHTYSKKEVASLLEAAKFSLMTWKLTPYHAFICTAQSRTIMPKS